MAEQQTKQPLPRPPRVRDGKACSHRWELVIGWNMEVGMIYGCPSCGALEYRVPKERHGEFNV